MSRLSRTLVLLATLAVAPLAASADLLPQTSDENGVKVTVTPRSIQGEAWEFDVVFDTHVQELVDELPAAAALVATDGAAVAARAWRGAPPGGHHRKGTLVFAPLEPRPPVLELRLSRPGEADPRSFEWDMR